MVLGFQGAKNISIYGVFFGPRVSKKRENTIYLTILGQMTSPSLGRRHLEHPPAFRDTSWAEASVPFRDCVWNHDIRIHNQLQRTSKNHKAKGCHTHAHTHTYIYLYTYDHICTYIYIFLHIILYTVTCS